MLYLGSIENDLPAQQGTGETVRDVSVWLLQTGAGIRTRTRTYTEDAQKIVYP